MALIQLSGIKFQTSRTKETKIIIIIHAYPIRRFHELRISIVIAWYIVKAIGQKYSTK